MQLGHGNNVNSIDVSRDGKFLLTSSLDTTVKLWEIASGKMINGFTPEKGEGIVESAFLGKGTTVISLLYSGAIVFSDAVAGRTTRRVAHSDYQPERFLVHEKDSYYITAGRQSDWGGSDHIDDSPVKAWDLESDRFPFSLKGRAAPFYAMALSPDGRKLALSFGDGFADI